MEQSSSWDEWTVRHQFDRICKLALKGEVIDYQRHMAYRQRHEVLLSELPEKELSKLFTMEKKRNVILLSYFLDMSDAEIAREMNLVRSTIHEHRKRSLELLKNIMEVSTDEKE